MSSFAIGMKTNVASLDLIFIGTNNANPNLILTFDKWKFSTAPIIDRQLSRQKIRQKISVIITNTCVFAQFSLVFAVFKTKHELKCQNELSF